MPSFPRIRYKTGVNPHFVQQFDLNNLTPTQKLMLVSTRIFGTNWGYFQIIRGNFRSGMKILRKKSAFRNRVRPFQYNPFQTQRLLPILKNIDAINQRNLKKVYKKVVQRKYHLKNLYTKYLRYELFQKSQRKIKKLTGKKIKLKEMQSKE